MNRSSQQQPKESSVGPNEHIRFVTGKFAAQSLRRYVEPLAASHGFSFDIEVLPITVAALMTTTWVARHLQNDLRADRLILPGYCDGDLECIRQQVDCRVEKGPNDFRFLAEYFGGQSQRSDDYDSYDIQIIAEINHAPKLAISEVVSQARALADDGADMIDLGSMPNNDWQNVGDYVRAVKDEGLRVSIDSLMPSEIQRAVEAGAELVLSVNGTNKQAASDWGCEVVAIPDQPSDLASLDATVNWLDKQGIPFRIDPIIEPIGCGFSESLGRYLQARRSYPSADIMMGIGNLTELTDADSAAVNVLLLGFCQEQRIHSVLTTQVIGWARSSVRECDLARRLVRESVRLKIPPKHIETSLILLRDERIKEVEWESLEELSNVISDTGYRIFVARDELHLIGKQIHLRAKDPFEIFDQLSSQLDQPLDASHAFYLGYELNKAMTALQLGKQYNQDEALDWGYLTVDEKDRHRISRRKRNQCPDLD